MSDIVEKINKTLNEETEGKESAAEILKNNKYIEDKNRACNNCNFYDEESYESFGACELALPKGVDDDNYSSTSTAVQNYGVCSKFKKIIY